MEKEAILMPTPYGRKSFYGKAHIIKTDAGYFLRSYQTIVCSYENGSFHRLWDGWSATTARHVDAFRYYFGLPGIGKGDWLKLPVESR